MLKFKVKSTLFAHFIRIFTNHMTKEKVVLLKVAFSYSPEKQH